MELERFVNESGMMPLKPEQQAVAATGKVEVGIQSAAQKQPVAEGKHRRHHMLPVRTTVLLTLAALPWSLTAQGAPADPPPPVALSSSLQPALSQVSQAVSGIDIRRWKAPNAVKTAAAGDVSSIQHDLTGTLAGLMSQAQAAPSSISSSFAVYRNVDALYDTLLRVVETADLAAPDQDATALGTALNQLEAARSDLGEKILIATQVQQNEVVRLRTVIARAAAAPPPPIKTVVVDDGPAKKETPVHHHTTKKPAPKPDQPAQKPTPQ